MVAEFIQYKSIREDNKKPYIKEDGRYREAQAHELENPNIEYLSEYQAIIANRILFRQKKDKSFGVEMLEKIKNN